MMKEQIKRHFQLGSFSEKSLSMIATNFFITLTIKYVTCNLSREIHNTKTNERVELEFVYSSRYIMNLQDLSNWQKQKDPPYVQVVCSKYCTIFF